MSTGKRCSKCGGSAGTCTCTGCKQLFCVTHFNDHRQQMAEILQTIMESCKQLTGKTQETILTQRAGSSLLSQIDEWQRSTMEKVAQAAENARQQAIQVMRRKKAEIMKGIETVSLEIRTRQGSGDFFEEDLTRLRNNINRIQQDLYQFNQRPIQIRTRKNDQLEWNNLISVDQQYGENYTRDMQPLALGHSTVERTQSARPKTQRDSARNAACRRFGGCEGCTFVSHGGGYYGGGYFRRDDGRTYCHCTCHQQQ